MSVHSSVHLFGNTMVTWWDFVYIYIYICIYIYVYIPQTKQKSKVLQKGHVLFSLLWEVLGSKSYQYFMSPMDNQVVISIGLPVRQGVLKQQLLQHAAAWNRTIIWRCLIGQPASTILGLHPRVLSKSDGIVDF